MMGYDGSPARESMGASMSMLESNPNTHPGAAATALLDIVVFAGGDSPDLMPLSAFEQKCMLRLCNRPMIWYCLAPWIEAGFRTFFIVVNEDYATLRTYLSREFAGVDFYFVLVPLMLGEEGSTTCDGVKAYLEFKEQMRAGTVDGSMAVQDSVRDGGLALNSGDSPTGQGRKGSAANTASSPTSTKPQPLRGERTALPSFQRDALLLSCDTILAGVDVDQFVSNFYSSMASVSAMLFRPLSPEKAAAAAAAASGGPGGAESRGAAKDRAHGKKGKQGQHAGPERKSFTYAYTCAAYEEADVIAGMAAGGVTAAQSGAAGLGQDGVSTGLAGDSVHHSAGGTFFVNDAANEASAATQHRRLHYMYPLDANPELRITMAFAARRPDLTFAADLVDAHAYLVRHWVLDMIAESAGTPDASVRKHIVPLLARSQHSVVNTTEGAFLTPDKKISHAIPPHWMYRRRDGDISIDTMSSAKGPMLPERGDCLRVFCTIYTETPTVPMKIYRVNTRDNYQAVNQELIASKCKMLHLLEEAGQAHAGAGNTGHSATAAVGAPGSTNTRGAGRGLSALRAPSTEALYSGALPAAPNTQASASALAYLLPDNPFTLREKLGSQQVYIVGSFVDSVPPPNTYITRSVIGSNVTIGPGARITDSVILANVDIGAKAVITNSVIGAAATVNGGFRVVNCVVSPQCVVEEDKEDDVVD